MAFPVGDRLWPNCLNRPFRNSGLIDIDDFVKKMNKSIVRYEAGISEKAIPKTAASRRRRKKYNTPLVKPSLDVHSLSSGILESPKSEKDVEMSAGRIYAKGIRQFSLY